MSAMRARTSASPAWDSTLLSLAVPMSVYVTAAHWLPRSAALARALADLLLEALDPDAVAANPREVVDELEDHV